MSYDKNYLIEHADLKEVYERVTGNSLRRHSDQWEGACPECGGTDRFRIPDRIPHKGFCRSCGKTFNAIDIVLSRYNVSFKDALAVLAEIIGVSESEAQYHGTGTGIISKPSERYTKYCALPDEPSDLWQQEVTDAVNHAHDVLMSDAGKKEREYLISRGFTVDTLKKYRIGFNPNKYPLNVTVKDLVTQKEEPVMASVGIYIPTFAKLMDDEPYESLLRVKVRCEDWKYKSLMKAYEEGQRDTPPLKYWHIKGGVPKSLFCADYTRDFDTNTNIIFTEGEFDAMTINQVAGDICRAVTFGSHTNIGDTADYWHAWFSAPSHIIVCFDNEKDQAKAQTVRKHEQDLRDEIIRAQSLDDEEDRADAPVIRHLDEQYHDWNDILMMPNGKQTIRDILTGWFCGADSHVLRCS